MRYLRVLAIAIASGCGPSSWTLVLDDAQLAAKTPASQEWCAQGRLPDVRTVFEVAGVKTSSSPALATLTPTWHEPIVSADEASFGDHLSFAVVGNCGQSDFTIDATEVRLSSKLIEGGALTLAGFGSIQTIGLHFESVSDSSGANPSSYDPGYYDPGYYDPGYYDPGYYDPGYYDPGSSDTNSGGDPSSGGDSSYARQPRLQKSAPAHRRHPNPGHQPEHRER